MALRLFFNLLMHCHFGCALIVSYNVLQKGAYKYHQEIAPLDPENQRIN